MMNLNHHFINREPWHFGSLHKETYASKKHS